ncbi:related to regulatory protein involved in control of sterol uptake [Phialocephala subalpina]|uniref:Related to regulatory protein involved in control of sterol uptake n=1 Tax=Phialocephala subalpina TaxID=576137 RepID=A0A1L7WV90_9HELO|nr:related to regulatory protein involved in control of sterol uptake [Phialocephala subalpina]
MHRRTHRKSRNGCGECKRRHVKVRPESFLSLPTLAISTVSLKSHVTLTNEQQCDETRPSCVSCLTAKLECSYTTKNFNHGTFIPFDHGHSSHSSLSPDHSNQSQIQVQNSFLSPSTPYVNLLHLEIFNHFAIDNQYLLPMDEISRAQKPLILQHAFIYPFLMFELLACSSMHLSLTHPDLCRRQIFHDEASRLQAEGLISFNEIVKEITDENLIAAFLFSALLGLHAFSSVFATPAEDLDIFLDRLVHSMRLLHGVNTILSGKWEMVRNSEIAPLLDVEDRSNSAIDDVVSGFSKFKENMTDLPGSDPKRVKVCQEAMEKMSWVYNARLGSMSPGGFANPRMVTTWPIMVSAEFTDLLVERSPEALIVLAHFAVLLHQCRKLWVVGNAGTILLDALGGYLPKEWDCWLVWPRTMIYGSL